MKKKEFKKIIMEFKLEDKKEGKSLGLNRFYIKK